MVINMVNGNYFDEIAHRFNSEEPIESIERDVSNYIVKWNLHDTLTNMIFTDLLKAKRSVKVF